MDEVVKKQEENNQNINDNNQNGQSSNGVQNNGSTQSEPVSPQEPVSFAQKDNFTPISKREINRQVGLTSTVNENRKVIEQLKRENKANGVYGDMPMSIFKFIASGYTRADDIVTQASALGIYLTLETDEIENTDLTKEQKEQIYAYGAKLYKEITTGNVVVGDDRYNYNPYTAKMFENVEGFDKRKFANVRQIKLGQGSELNLGGGATTMVYHEDEYSSSLGAAIDLNGNLVPINKIVYGPNRMMRELVYDPQNDASYYVWREVKPSEFVPEGSIRTIFGDRRVESSSMAASFGRGALSFAGDLTAGVGWIGGLFGATEFENRTYQFKGAVTHRNKVEEQGAFDNPYAFMFGAGNTIAQTAATVALGYVGGIGVSAFTNSARAVSIGSKTLSVGMLSSSQAASTYSDLVSRGVDKNVARNGSIMLGAIMGVTELFGPNILIDPIKNRYAKKKSAEMMANILTDKFVANGGNLAKKKAAFRVLSKTGQALEGISSRLDKTAFGRGILSVMEEVPEELHQDLWTNNFINPVINKWAYEAANEQRREIDRSKVAMTSEDGRIVGYSYIDRNGNVAFITADDYQKNLEIVKNGGVYSESEMDTWGNAMETVVMTAIGTFPAGVMSFYGSKRSDFDPKSMYDLAYGVATGRIKESDALEGLKELHKQNRLLQMSVKQGKDGEYVTQDAKNSYKYYEQSFLDELHTLVDVIRDNNLSNPETLEAMSDANGMNRYVLHGALGASLRIKEFTEAIENYNNGKKVEDGRFVSSTMSIEEMQKELEKAKKDYEYFSIPSNRDVEIGNLKLKATQSQAVHDYYLHNSLIPQTIINEMYSSFREEAIKSGLKDEKEIKQYADKKLIGAIKSTRLDENINQFLASVSKTDADVLNRFRERRDGIESVRTQKEQELLAEKERRLQEAEANRENVKKLKEKLEEVVALSKARARILQDINAFKQQLPDAQKTLEEALALKKYKDNLLKGKDEAAALRQQMQENGTDGTQQYSEEVIRAREEAIDAELEKLGDLDAIDKAYEEAKAKIEQLSIGISENESFFKRHEESTGRILKEISDLQNSLSGHVLSEDYSDIDNEYSNLSPFFEGEYSDMDANMAEALDELNSQFAKNVKDIGMEADRDFVADENGNKVPIINDAEREAIFANSIMEYFFKPEHLALVNKINDTLSIGEELNLTKDEIDLFEEVDKAYKLASLYIFHNVGFFQKNIEESTDKKTYTELNNRTRINGNVTQSVADMLTSVKLAIELAKLNNKSLDDIRRNVRFRATALHMNLAYIGVDVLLDNDGYEELALKDKELKDKANEFIYNTLNLIDEFNKKFGTDYTSLLDIQEAFAKSSAEQKDAMEQLMLDVEKMYVAFATKFYEVNRNELNSADGAKADEYREGILKKVHKLSVRLANEGIAAGLNNKYNYFVLQPESIGIFEKMLNVKRVIDDKTNETTYVDNRTGEVIASNSNELVALYFLNMLHTNGSVSQYAMYNAIKDVIEKADNGEPVPTTEQQYAIIQLLAHMTNPSNRDLELDDFDEADKRYLIDNLIYIKGAAGSGKTTVIFKTALRAYKKLNNIAGNPKVLVIAPTREVGELSKKAISNEGDVTVRTYNEVIFGEKSLAEGFDFVILDESTLLENDDVIALKDKLSGTKSVVVALGDEFQTRNTSATLLPPISKSGKKTLRITEQHRSKISTIKNLQESLVAMVLTNVNIALPSLQYTKQNGVAYGGKYFATRDEIIEAFKNDPSDDAILVVETEAEANALRQRFNTNKIYSTEFMSSNVESTCVSGISAKRVYVAIDTSIVSDGFSYGANKILTAASRATEFVALLGDGETKEVQLLAGLKEHLDENSNGANFADEKKKAIDRIDYILKDQSDASNEPLVEVSNENTKENTNEENTKENTNEENTENEPNEEPKPDDTKKRNWIFRQSAYVSRMIDTTMHGFNSVKTNVINAIKSFSVPQIETEENVESLNIVGELIEKKEKTETSVRRKLIKTIIQSIHEAYQRFSNNKEDLEDYIAEKYLEEEDKLSPEERGHELTNPGRIVDSLLKNAQFKTIASDNQRVFNALFRVVVNHDGKQKILTANMFGYRLVGEIDGKPIINPTTIEVHSSKDILEKVRKLFDGLMSGTEKGYEEFENAYNEESAVGNSLRTIIGQIAINEVLVANRAIIGQHEIMLSQSFLEKSNLGFVGNIAIDAAVLRPYIQDVLNNRYKLSVAGVTEQEYSEHGALYGDRETSLDEVVNYEKARKQDNPKTKIELRENRLAVFNKDGKLHAEYISYPFMRYIDGKPILMVVTKNGTEIEADKIVETHYESSQYDHQKELLKENKKYVGTYYAPADLSKEERVKLTSIRRRAIAALAKRGNVTLVRGYMPSKRLVFLEGGKEIIDDVKHVVYYGLQLSDIDSLVGTVITKDEAAILAQNNVIAIEPMGRLSTKANASNNNIGIFERAGIKQHWTFKKAIEYIEKSKGKTIDNLSEQDIKDVMNFVNEYLRNYDEELAPDAIEQFEFILRSRNNLAGKQTATIAYMENVSLHSTDRNIEGNDINSMLPLGAFQTEIEADSNLGNFTVDSKIEQTYLSEDIRKSSALEQQSGAKPQFKVNVVNRETGHITQANVVTPTLREVNIREFVEVMISNLEEIALNEPDADLSRLKDSLFGVFKDVNSNYIRHKHTSLRVGRELDELFHKFFRVHASSFNKGNKLFLRTAFGTGKNIKEFYEYLVNNREDFIKLLGLYENAYIPAIAYNLNSELVKNYMQKMVRVQVGRAENSLFASPGLVISRPISQNITSIGEANGVDNVNLDEDFDIFMKKLPSDNEKLQLVSYEDARNMLIEMLGEEYVNENFQGFDEALKNPITRADVLGYVYKAKMKLRSINGEVDKNTVIHEAAHVVYEYMIDEESRLKIAREIKSMYGEDIDVHEKIAELAESHEKPKSTILERFIQLVKHFLNRIGVYAYSTNDFLDGLLNGDFAGNKIHMPQVGADNAFAKEYKYGSVKPLIETFGSISNVHAYVRNKVVPLLRSNMYINGYVNRKGTETLESAIKGTFSKLYSPKFIESKIENAKRNNVEVEDIFKHDIRNLGNEERLINGQYKKIKHISVDDINYLSNSSDPYDKETANLFLLHRLANPKIVKTLIQAAIPEIDIAKVLERGEKENKNDVGNKTSGVVRNDNSAETTDIYKTISPFVRFVVSTTRLYTQISHNKSGNTIVIDETSESGYIKPDVAHAVLIDAAKRANTIDPEQKDMVGSFIKALGDIAEGRKGEYRQTALSLLAEFGNVKKEYTKVPEAKKALYRNVFVSGFFGMYNMSDAELANHGYSAEQIKNIRTKGERIFSEFLVPLSNLYRSLEARNTIDVTYVDGKVNIIKNDSTTENAVRGRVKDTMVNKFYDEDGFVNKDSLDEFFSYVKVSDKGISITHNGETRSVIKYSNGEFIFDASNEHIKSDIITLLKRLGIKINSKSAKALAAEIDVKNGRVIINGFENPALQIAGMLLSLKVNSSYSEYYRVKNDLKNIIKNANDEYTAEQVTDAIKQLKELEQKYKRMEYAQNTFDISISDEQLLGKIHRKLYKDEVGFAPFDGDEVVKIPSVADFYHFLTPLSDVIAMANGEVKSTSFRNKENNIEQRNIIGNQLLRLFSNGGSKLKKVFEQLKNVSSAISESGKVFSILSDYAAAFKGTAIKITIETLYDIENYLSGIDILHYNKTPFADRFKAHITDFVNNLLYNNDNTATVAIIGSPDSDRRNNKVFDVNPNGMVKMSYDKTSKTVTATVNKKMVVDAIYNNVLYVKKAQMESINRVSSTIDEFASIMDIDLNYEKTVSGINSVLSTLSANYGEVFADFVKNRLTNIKDYRIKGGKVVAGNAINLNHSHNPYTNEFVEQMIALQSKAGTENAYDEAYSLIKKHFYNSFVQFSNMLVSNRYRMPLAYKKAFNKNKAEEYDKNVKEILEKHNELIESKLQNFYNEKKNSIDSAIGEDVDYSDMQLRALENAMVSIREKKKISSFKDYVDESGEYTDEGAVAAAYVREFIESIQKDIRSKDRQIKKQGDIVHESDIADYIDPDDNMQWNQIYEGYFFLQHITNYEVQKLTKGASLFTKDLIDNVKRAGSTAPAIVPTIGVKKGLPSKINYLVVDFGGGAHEQVYEGDKQKYDPELKSNGQGLLNPIAAVWMQNSFGREYGPVGSTMVKSVVHYYDYENNNVPYLKQAMRHITGQTIRISSQDYQVFKAMNKAIWNVKYDGKRTIGQVFDDYVARKSDESFEEIINNVVNILENNPELKEKIAYQAIDPSAIKTGVNKVYSINEIIANNDDNIIETLKEMGEITYTNDENMPCLENGAVFGFNFGSKWSIVTDLKGMPSHAKGGVDLKISENSVSFVRNNSEVKAKHGLYIDFKTLQND